ncbi:azurin [Aeromonas cavernicola]|uniref:Azurin n=1 Tax=Aeromonas cavernicola TaxID=1006623 RepID=A0A2H9U639_9GAMM|nr:azurin [Aeromonas cavernicola]PJG59507.1 azurin [Aeromonas cavernicola]
MKKVMTLLLLSGLAAPALADECALVIEGNDAMQYNLKEMSVPATCKEVTITLNHTGKLPVTTMGHNWALSSTADYQAVATAGITAGADNAYLPKDDPRVLAYTKLIGGGESTSVTFKTEGLAGKDLTFFCSFPGHFAMMKGSFKVG